MLLGGSEKLAGRDFARPTQQALETLVTRAFYLLQELARFLYAWTTFDRAPASKGGKISSSNT